MILDDEIRYVSCFKGNSDKSNNLEYLEELKNKIWKRQYLQYYLQDNMFMYVYVIYVYTCVYVCLCLSVDLC